MWRARPLPLFPLGTVLFPGMPLPLNIFEPRYRDCGRPAAPPAGERAFGVIAIREGWEVGDVAVHSAHRVGCEAVVEEITERPDGRYDLEAVGGRRFRMDGIDDSSSYLTGEVTFLDETDGADVDAACGQALAAFEAYRTRLSAMQGAEVRCTSCRGRL